MLTKSGRMWFRTLWRLEVNYENEKKITKTAVFPRNGHSWLYQGRYRVILTWLSISCIKKQKRKKNYTIQATAMKKSRINSVQLNGRRPLKIEPNHGLMIIILRRRVEKLMNMNEQPVGTRLSKNWTQLAEPKEERTRFRLGQESLQREKNNKVGIEKYTV